MKLLELFNRPSSVMMTADNPDYKSFKSTLQDGSTLTVQIMQAMMSGDEANEWELEFKTRGTEQNAPATAKKTGRGNEMDVFSTVMYVAKWFMQKQQPNVLEFTAERPENDPRPESRAKLYRRLATQMSGPEYHVQETDNGDHVKFVITKRGHQRKQSIGWS